MLSNILSKEECASCRFCCSFRRQSAWETPLFTKEKIDELKKKYGEFDVKKYGDSYTLELSNIYKTDSEDEEAPCPFLDVQKGCILSEEDKPFDCKIWPLRVMENNGRRQIVLTPTCPSINKKPVDEVKKMVKGGLAQKIFEYADNMPDMVKEYRESYIYITDKKDGET